MNSYSTCIELHRKLENPPKLLSALINIDELKSKRIDFLKEYEVVQPLFSSSTNKSRYICSERPISKIINGAFDLKNNKVVLVKLFEQVNSTPIEVRFLSSGGDMITYFWDRQLRDGIRVDSTNIKEVQVDNKKIKWSFMSSASCKTCHRRGGALGFEYRQISAIDNQMNYLKDEKVISRLINNPKLTKLVSISNERYDLEYRVRSYLHVNCSSCHNPQGAAPFFNIKFDTKLADTRLINVAPSVYINDRREKLIMPGNSQLSTLFQRISSTNYFHMPPSRLSNSAVDEKALRYIKTWIESL